MRACLLCPSRLRSRRCTCASSRHRSGNSACSLWRQRSCQSSNTRTVSASPPPPRGLFPNPSHKICWRRSIRLNDRLYIYTSAGTGSLLISFHVALPVSSFSFFPSYLRAHCFAPPPRTRAVIALKGVCVEALPWCIITELCDFGDLKRVLRVCGFIHANEGRCPAGEVDERSIRSRV